MENYESLGTIGEGTYGVVLKCRHKITGQIVAIKKFKESDDDEQVKKTALREIKILKQLKHENIVSLLEVFRVKGKLYLVFEYVEKTILEEIEKNPEGLDPHHIKRLMWQLVRAIHFCHQHNIIHRDIKPENLLVSRNGVLKLCDFGFARPLAGAGAKYTEYVSTRWYRAPELLVGDVSYGKAVDVWSIGCMFAEITTGLPLFPGDSDIDQLYHIIKCLGTITPRQQELFKKNSLYVGVKLPHATEREPLEARFPQFNKHSMDLLKQTVKEEPLDRWTCAELLTHPFFDNCSAQFERELEDATQRDLNDTMALRKKRTRIHKPPPSRGASNDYQEVEYDAPHIVKSSGKPVLAVVTPMKDKPHVVMPKKPTLGPGYTTSSYGGSMLPTIQSSTMTPSSSSTSTVSIESSSTPTSTPPATHTHHHPQDGRKKVGAVLPMPSHTDSYAFHPPPHHLQQHQHQHQPPPRVSLTSHGTRPTIPASTLYHTTSTPQSQAGFTPSLLQRPPPVVAVSTTAAQSKPVVYPASPYSTTKASRVFPKPVSSLQSSMEIYSPSKKSSSHSQSSSSHRGSSSVASPFTLGSKKPGAMASAIAPLPEHAEVAGRYTGYYVPPKTSHGGAARRRGPPPGGKHRRADNDSHRT